MNDQIVECVSPCVSGDSPAFATLIRIDSVADFISDPGGLRVVGGDSLRALIRPALVDFKQSHEPAGYLGDFRLGLIVSLI